MVILLRILKRGLIHFSHEVRMTAIVIVQMANTEGWKGGYPYRTYRSGEIKLPDY